MTIISIYSAVNSSGKTSIVQTLSSLIYRSDLLFNEENNYFKRALVIDLSSQLLLSRESVNHKDEPFMKFRPRGSDINESFPDLHTKITSLYRNIPIILNPIIIYENIDDNLQNKNDNLQNINNILENSENATIYHEFYQKKFIHILPGHVNLFNNDFEQELSGELFKEIITTYISHFNYDLILLDLDSNINFKITQLALTYCNYILIPCTLDRFSLVTIELLSNYIFTNNSVQAKVLSFIIGPIDKNLSEEMFKNVIFNIFSKCQQYITENYLFDGNQNAIPLYYKNENDELTISCDALLSLVKLIKKTL